MTPAQEAFAAGFSALSESFDPEKSWAFGGASFAGVICEMKPDDPRMSGSGDRLFFVTVATASLPAIKPSRGDDLSHGGKFYRITQKPNENQNTGETIFIVSDPT